MCGHVQLRVVEDFFLEKLLFGLLVHVFLEEMKGSVSLLGLDGSAETLLFLENCVEVLVVCVVAAALDVAHWIDVGEDWLREV